MTTIVEGYGADELIHAAWQGGGKIEVVYEDYEVNYFICPLPGGSWLTWNDLESHKAVLCSSRAEAIEYLAWDAEEAGRSCKNEEATARYAKLAAEIRRQA